MISYGEILFGIIIIYSAKKLYFVDSYCQRPNLEIKIDLLRFLYESIQLVLKGLILEVAVEELID